MASKALSKREATRYGRYVEQDGIIQAAFPAIVAKTADYWMACYAIWHEKLWDVSFGTEKEWLGDLCTQVYGPSRTQFFEVMGAVKRLTVGGMSEDGIRFAIGMNKTAVVYDSKNLFDKVGGQYTLKPEVAERLEQEGQTFGDFVMGVASQGAGQARKSVASATGQEKRTVFPHSISRVDGLMIVKLVQSLDGEVEAMADITIDVKNATGLMTLYIDELFSVGGK